MRRIDRRCVAAGLHERSLPSAVPPSAATKPGAFRNATDAEKFVGGAIDARKADIDDWLNGPLIPGTSTPLNTTMIVDVDDFGEGITTGKVLINRSTGEIADASGIRLRLVRKPMASKSPLPTRGFL